jgi:hypothetical protein
VEGGNSEIVVVDGRSLALACSMPAKESPTPWTWTVADSCLIGMPKNSWETCAVQVGAPHSNVVRAGRPEAGRAS